MRGWFGGWVFWGGGWLVLFVFLWVGGVCVLGLAVLRAVHVGRFVVGFCQDEGKPHC